MSRAEPASVPLFLAVALTCYDAAITAVIATLYPGRFIELNPVMAMAIDTAGVAAAMTVRAAIGILAVVTVHLLARRTSSRFGRHAMAVAVLVLTAIATWNTSVLTLI